MAELGHGVRDDQDRTAVVGEAAQQLHDVAVHARVEAGGRLVQEDQRRLGQQLQGDGDALALAAGERGDLLLLVDVELELAQHLVDAGVALGLGGVAGEAQLGRVLEGLRTVSSLCRMSSCGTRPMRWRSSANCL